jgi:DNA-binding NarL/FixJ family response regulator
VTALLPAEFHPVASLSSGDGLAAAIAEHHPDIVVLDITLPGANGIELASRLRATAGCPKIVILTVHDDPDYLRAALEAGAAAYVVKARLLQDLVPALTAVRGGRQFVSASGGLADD